MPNHNHNQPPSEPKEEPDAVAQVNERTTISLRMAAGFVAFVGAAFLGSAAWIVTQTGGLRTEINSQGREILSMQGKMDGLAATIGRYADGLNALSVRVDAVERKNDAATAELRHIISSHEKEDDERVLMLKSRADGFDAYGSKAAREAAKEIEAKIEFHAKAEDARMLDLERKFEVYKAVQETKSPTKP